MISTKCIFEIQKIYFSVFQISSQMNPIWACLCLYIQKVSNIMVIISIKMQNRECYFSSVDGYREIIFKVFFIPLINLFLRIFMVRTGGKWSDDFKPRCSYVWQTFWKRGLGDTIVYPSALPYSNWLIRR